MAGDLIGKESRMPDLQEVPATTNVERLKTDSSVAQDLRQDILPLLNGVCAVMDRARAQGLKVGFNVSQDNFGRHRVTDIEIVKPL